MVSTEDKQSWCKYGLELEFRFVRDICPKIGLDAKIHPMKLIDKYAPDLLVNGKIYADLKHQSTPFFTANKWGLDPMYAVSFNRKDYERYSERYPNLLIFFWIERIPKDFWIDKWKWDKEPMCGVWMESFQFIKKLIDDNPILHAYQKRVNDNLGNAKDSYIFDVRRLKCLTR